MSMTKTMKISNETISIMDDLKPEYVKRFPEIYISYDFIINNLLYEHNVLNNPERIEKEKKKLLQDYVPKTDFNDVFDKKVEFEEKLFELSEKYEKVKGESESELEKLRESFNLEKQECQREIDNLKKELITKKEELSLLNQKNNELTEKIMNLEINLTELQKKYDKCKSNYDDLKEFVDQECITKKMLKTMYYIAWFLTRHKRSMYTAQLICDKLCYKMKQPLIIEEIQEALYLSNFKIFPVRHVQQDSVDFFYFDKEYLG